MASPRGPFYREFGKKLSQARRNAKLSQAALAQALGLTRTSITNIEKGRQAVQVDTLVKMADLLHRNVSELLPERKPVAANEVAAQLERFNPVTRGWVERVIGDISSSEEEILGTKILTSSKESKSPASRSKSKTSPGGR